MAAGTSRRPSFLVSRLRSAPGYKSMKFVRSTLVADEFDDFGKKGNIRRQRESRPRALLDVLAPYREVSGHFLLDGSDGDPAVRKQLLSFRRATIRTWRRRAATLVVMVDREIGMMLAGPVDVVAGGTGQDDLILRSPAGWDRDNGATRR